MPRIKTEDKLDREIAAATEEEQKLKERLANLRKRLNDAKKAKRLREAAQRRKNENHIKFTIGGEFFALGMTMEQAAEIRQLADRNGGVAWLLSTLRRAGTNEAV